MSNVWFISDMHFGHKNIIKYGRVMPDGSVPASLEDCFEEQLRCYNLVVKPKDVVYLLGDIWFGEEALRHYAPRMNGRKKLILGNHDYCPIPMYLEYCEAVGGLWSSYEGKALKGLWASHAPIHPAELRGKFNVHGHDHHADKYFGPEYINVNTDVIGFTPMSIDTVRAIMKNQREEYHAD